MRQTVCLPGFPDSVRKSTDGGLSWATLNLGIGANDQVFDVTIDPSNPSILWAGVADASGAQPVNVVRSTDGGATWSNRTPPLAAPISAQGIAVDPNNSNTVIAVFGGAFGGGEAWVTTDGGDSWVDRSAGLPGNPLNAVVYDGTRLLVGGGLLFGSQFVGLYESSDLGVTWTPLHDNSWPILVVEDIAVDPSNARQNFCGDRWRRGQSYHRRRGYLADRYRKHATYSAELKGQDSQRFMTTTSVHIGIFLRSSKSPQLTYRRQDAGGCSHGAVPPCG